MQERHTDKKRYFNEQVYTSGTFCIPFISAIKPVVAGLDVLEVGCGEGGNMVPFIEKGCKVIGVDISCDKIENGKKFLAQHPQKDNIVLVCHDIYTWKTDKLFDIIYLRDVLEHLPGQENFLLYIKKFLKPGGCLFLGFPPWQNPFGGHHQICENKYLATMPWIHLLPEKWYYGLLKRGGETNHKIEVLREVRETRITIGQFLGMAKRQNYTIRKSMYFFFNPNYKVKFGLPVWRQPLSFIPVLRNFIVTTCYYVISPK